MAEFNDRIEKDIQDALADVEAMLREQYARNERIAEKAKQADALDGGKAGDNCADGSKAGDNCADGKACRKTVIGLAPGDGIGPYIMKEVKPVLEELLKSEISEGTVDFKDIDGFTLERRLETGETVPADVLEQLSACDVLLKGPTTTPNASMGGKNLESANVFLRKKFDLYANVRPVKLDEEGIDWTFFRENTEGEYALGSRGIRLGDALSMDFKVTTNAGTRRIAKAAFDFARANGKKRVSIVTKANIMKKTDGDFQSICLDVAKDYPEIQTDCWFVDIMAANLVNKDIRSDFEVFVLPNLYGDIITDEAAQIQGGVGTAGSANIGADYALFEAIHGSAPRMVAEGIADLANPASLMTAGVMLLRHIGLIGKAAVLEDAIRLADSEIGSQMTGMPGGASCKDFAKLVLENITKTN
jgi:isocitrate dehydrogenase (NAD+)